MAVLAMGTVILAGIVLMNAPSSMTESTTTPDTIDTIDTIEATDTIDTIEATDTIDTIEATDTTTNDTTTDTTLSPIISVNPDKSIDIMVTDGIKHTIPLNEIRSGGPPKDGIPSIDNPVFVKAQDASFVMDSDIVMGIEIDGVAKAYPLFILVWHEIVNDEIDQIPVAVTYCPLCYTMQVFERVVDGQTVEFGTTGKLYNSNLLMYDRLTDTYWSQAIGMAVKGPLSGDVLNRIPFDIITWDDWKSMHPDTLVLTTDTGHIRAYDVDPYNNYYTDPRIIFPINNRDDRLHPKSIILGFNLSGVSKAYVQSTVESEIVVNDVVGDTPVLLVSLFKDNTRAFDRNLGNQVLEFEYLSDDKITDTSTGSIWNYAGQAVSGDLRGEQLSRLSIEPGFWFEWVAFHPDTLLYGDDGT